MLAVDLPREAPVNTGVLLEDPAGPFICPAAARLERDRPGKKPRFWRRSRTDLAAQSAEVGAARLMEHLEADAFEHAACFGTARESWWRISTARLSAPLPGTRPQPACGEFVTHLPRYSLAVAAGKFLENPEVTRRRLGRSARRPENDAGHVRRANRRPLDGAENSRRKLVRLPLGRDRIAAGPAGAGGALGGGANDRYTVKRYRSSKRPRRRAAGPTARSGWNR